MVIKPMMCFRMILIVTLLFTNISVTAADLKVGLMSVSRDYRNAFERIGVQFQIENKGHKIRWVIRNDARYKKDLTQWLTRSGGPDVVWWQAGERLYHYVRQGLILPVSDLWKKEDLDQFYSQGVKNIVSLKGDVYAIPYSYYQWGFYYREKTFQQHNVKPPKTWPELLQMCQTFRKQGVTPFVIGTKNDWPTAAWFDYLNLRINGIQFHRELTSGEVPYTDNRVRDVFAHWKELLNSDCFIDTETHRSWDWAQALPDIYQGKAVTGLFGNFVTTKFRSSWGIRYFPFPHIKNVPVAEEAPTDVFMIPKNSKQKNLARKFLAFIGRADIQQQLNSTSGTVSTNLQAKVSDNYFIRQGTKTLKAAEGISQFFDRDTPKPMAAAGIRIFTEFMVNKDINKAMSDLESARKKFY